MIAWPDNTLAIDAICPVDWADPLNSGLGVWLLVVPGWGGGGTWQNLCRNQYGYGTLKAADRPKWVGPVANPWGGFGALSFNSSDETVTIPRIVLSATVPWSISYWIHGVSVTTDGAIIMGSESPTQRFIWHYQASSQVRLRMAGGDLIINDVWVPFGAPHHYTFTSDTVNVVMYIDGVFNETNVVAGDMAIDTIGNYFHPTQYQMTGYLDDIRIWPARSLTAADTWALYQDSRRGYQRTLQRISPRSWFLVGDSGAFVTGVGVGQGSVSLSAAAAAILSATPSILGFSTGVSPASVLASAPSAALGFAQGAAPASSSIFAPAISTGMGHSDSVASLGVGGVGATGGAGVGASIATVQTAGNGIARNESPAAGTAALLAAALATSQGISHVSGPSSLLASAAATSGGLGLGVAVSGSGSIAVSAAGVSIGGGFSQAHATVISASWGSALAAALASVSPALLLSAPGTSLGLGGSMAPATLLTSAPGVSPGFSYLAGLLPSLGVPQIISLYASTSRLIPLPAQTGRIFSLPAQP